MSKKNNYIDINTFDKNILTPINDEIKENLSKYISEKEINIKNNLSKIVFNDIFINNKMHFNMSDDIDVGDIDKKSKYECSFNIPYVILIFVGTKMSEVNVKVELSSLKGDECSNIIIDNNNDNDTSNGEESDTNSESINIDKDNNSQNFEKKIKNGKATKVDIKTESVATKRRGRPPKKT